MNQPLFFDQLKVGDSWTSQSRTITESDVVNFAGLTGDYDPLHVDHEYAAQTPFRRPIAHGLLGLAWVAGLASQAPRVSTVAFVGIKDWQFLKASFIGDTVHAQTEVAELNSKGKRRGQVIWRRQLINQHDEVVQDGFFETLVMVAPASAKPKKDTDSSDESNSKNPSSKNPSSKKPDNNDDEAA
jgi:3-hydroxybutyryl-CoA dehydratase